MPRSRWEVGRPRWQAWSAAALLAVVGCPSDHSGVDAKDSASAEAGPREAGPRETGPRDATADGDALSAATSHSMRLWYGPNVASADMLDLFKKPDAWRWARGKIGVFKFLIHHVQSNPCTVCGPNVLSAFRGVQAFSKLESWGVDISLSGGVIKEWNCTSDYFVQRALEGIANIQKTATLRYLAMDEPYCGGEHTIGGKSCGNTMQQSAEQTARFFAAIKGAHPQLRIGDVEPYPYFSAAQLKAWTVELVARGVKPDFFQLDVHRKHPSYTTGKAAADLDQLKKFYAARKIPFGIIFWGQEGNSEQLYFNDVLAWAQEVKAAIGTPVMSSFQSWERNTAGEFAIPTNLPEVGENVFSHTRLINASWGVLVDNDARFVSQTVPASAKAGQSMQVEITMENRGPYPWTERDGYHLGTEDPSWGTARVGLTQAESIAPTTRKTFSFSVTAPTKAGTYPFRWRMVQEAVEWFGEQSDEVMVTVTP